MRGRVEVCRVEAPVEEGEEGGQAQHRHHNRDPHPPHHVARFYGVHKGRVEDPRREMEQEPTALQFAGSGITFLKFEQCCGSGMFIPDPNLSTPDPRDSGFRFQIRIKEFKYF